MSLIKCDECGKEISSKAFMCLHCGNPISYEDDVDSTCECDDCDCHCSDVYDEKNIVRKFCFFSLIVTFPGMLCITGMLCSILECCFDLCVDEFFGGFVCGIMVSVWFVISKKIGKYFYNLVV